MKPKLRLSFLSLRLTQICPPPVIFPLQDGSLPPWSQVRVDSLQVSDVQTFPSLQVFAGPLQVPLVQLSPLGPVQKNPSSQAVPLGL